MPKLARGTRWSVTVAALMAAAAVSLSACNPLSYGCHRQGSHGAVVCIGTNHDPSA